jgi:hypothetical protein
MTHEFVPDPVGPAHEIDADAQMPRGRKGTVDGTPGRVIAAHGVDRDAQWRGGGAS